MYGHSSSHSLDLPGSQTGFQLPAAIHQGPQHLARTLYGQYLDGEDGPGRTPEQLAEDFDLPVEAVREAIVYCEANPPEIRADWEMEEAVMEATGMNEPNYKYHPSPRPLSREDYLRIYGR